MGILKFWLKGWKYIFIMSAFFLFTFLATFPLVMILQALGIHEKTGIWCSYLIWIIVAPFIAQLLVQAFYMNKFAQIKTIGRKQE